MTDFEYGLFAEDPDARFGRIEALEMYQFLTERGGLGEVEEVLTEAIQMAMIRHGRYDVNQRAVRESLQAELVARQTEGDSGE